VPFEDCRDAAAKLTDRAPQPGDWPRRSSRLWPAAAPRSAASRWPAAWASWPVTGVWRRSLTSRAIRRRAVAAW